MKGLSILLGFQMLLFPAMLVPAVEMKDRIERGVEDYYERMRRSSEMEMIGDVNEERRALDDDDDDDDYKGIEASERRKDEKIKRAVGHIATDRINQAAEASIDENVSDDSEEISDDERMNKVKMKKTMKPSVENSPDDEDNLYRASAEGSKRKIRAHEDSDNNRVNIAGEASFKDRLIRAIEKKQNVHHNKANDCKMKEHQKKKTADNTKEEEKTKTAAAESVAYERMKRAVDDLINKAADNEDKERMRRAWR
ncbi:UNVERIFIED_CONTAM: hypothetical protein FKN15_075663 [Acipenser sinensis]